MSFRENLRLYTKKEDRHLRWSVQNLSLSVIFVGKPVLHSSSIHLPFTHDVSFSMELVDTHIINFTQQTPAVILNICFNNTANEDRTFWYRDYICNNNSDDGYTAELLHHDSKYKKFTIKAMESIKCPINLRRSSVVSPDADDFDITLRIEEVTQNNDHYFQRQGGNNSCPKFLKTMLDDDVYKDVEIIVGDQTLMAHKAVIAARSKIFHAKLAQEYIEKRSDNVITVDGFSPDVFKAFLKYIYTDEIENLEKLAGDLVELAVQFDIQCLRRKCELYLCQTLDESKAVDALIKANLNDLQMLKKRALTLICIHQKKIQESQEFQKLYAEPALLDLVFKSICHNTDYVVSNASSSQKQN